MTSREERIVLMNLSELLASDLAAADDEALVAGLQDAEQVAGDAGRWAGLIVRELKRRYSWSRVVELTGLKQTTLHNRMYGRPGRRAEETRPVPESASKPEHQPVVAAIVTSTLGVLAGRRNDGKPPWTFIAGEVEPGESAADAAIREVKEETGLQVRAGFHEIGRRVHPATKRTMIYLACTPTHGTDVFVGDEEELAEVRWLNLREVDELLAGIYKPVREHLGRVL